MQGLQQDESLMASAVAARASRIALARQDPNTFVELVMHDEATGASVEQAECHLSWHDAMDEYERVLLFAHIESGKTSQVAGGRVLWELGRNPNLRVAIVSNTYHQAEKSVRVVAEYIKSNAMVQAIFPELVPSEPWTHPRITVKRDVVSRNPSVQAVGVHGNILGARLDLIILDDILDYENTLTARQRQDMWDWYHSTLAGRLTAGGRVVAIGTAWHPDDIYHRFERMPAWKVLRYPVIDKAGNPTWPERWPKDRIDTKRAELGPLEFARQMLCKARDDGESRFRQEWVDLCLENGEGLSTVRSVEELLQQDGVPAWMRDKDGETAEAIDAARRLLAEHGGKCYTGVDLGVSRNDSSDETVLFTIYVRPDGRRQVAEVLAGKWTGPEIVQRIISAHDRFESIVLVENNAAQDFILQFVRAAGQVVPVLPFTTGRAKAHPELGVESIAAEFAAGKWIIPSRGGKTEDEQVAKWIEELLYYDPQGHTGDRLMASWFARELARRGEKSDKTKINTRVIG